MYMKYQIIARHWGYEEFILKRALINIKHMQVLNTKKLTRESIQLVLMGEANFPLHRAFWVTFWENHMHLMDKKKTQPHSPYTARLKSKVQVQQRNIHSKREYTIFNQLPGVFIVFDLRSHHCRPVMGVQSCIHICMFHCMELTSDITTQPTGLLSYEPGDASKWV